MRKTWVYAIAILLSLTISIIPSPSIKAGPLVTSVSMEADPYVEVNVSPGSTGTDIIQGNVTCQTTNPVTPVTVSLSATSTVGIAVITPPSMEFQGTQQTEEFQVIINAPIGETASTDHSCTVTGTWQQGGQTGDVDPSTTQVVVLAFSLVNIISTEIEKDVEKGDSVSFTIKLENQGNCDDVYNIEIANREDLESKGITVGEIAGVEVFQGESDFAIVEVHVSTDSTTDLCRVDLVVTGTAEEDSEEFYYRLNVRIKEGSLRSNNPLGAAIVLAIISAILVGILLFARKKRREKETATPPNQ